MAYIRIIRPFDCFMTSMITIIGQTIVLGNIPKLIIATPTFLTIFFMTACSLTINDYIDYEIDGINAPWRPIPSGMITRNKALRFGLTLGSIGVLISLFSPPSAYIIAIGYLLLTILYTLKGKYWGFIGHVMIAFSISSMFIFGALTTREKINPLMLGIFCMSFLYVLGGEVIQSIADLEGDKVKGVKSMAIINGPKVAAVTATVCFLCTAFIGVITSLVYRRRFESYTLLTIPLTFTIILYITLPVLKNPNKKIAKKVRNRINYLAYTIITLLLLATLLL